MSYGRCAGWVCVRVAGAVRPAVPAVHPHTLNGDGASDRLCRAVLPCTWLRQHGSRRGGNCHWRERGVFFCLLSIFAMKTFVASMQRARAMRADSPPQCASVAVEIPLDRLPVHTQCTTSVVARTHARIERLKERESVRVVVGAKRENKIARFVSGSTHLYLRPVISPAEDS